MSDSEPENKKRMWRIDPSIFVRARKAKHGERLADLVKPVARLLALSLFFGYPLGLVVLGFVFGWIVFWSSLVGSFALIGLILSRLGYSRNFASWNPSLPRQLLVLTGAFASAAVFYIGLFDLGVWMIPILFGIFVSGLVLGFMYLRHK